MADGDANLILKGFDSYEVSLGDALRGERATLGKSLLDVERDLKIRAAYISAIEECDIDAFPNTGFVAGYVRSYARYLNLDPDPTFEAFCREANFKGTDVTNFQPTPKLKGNKKRAKGNQISSVNDKWEPGAVGIVAVQSINTTNLIHSIGPLIVLVLLLASLSYGGWKIFENIQRIDLVAIEQSPIVENSPISNIDNFGFSEEKSGVTVNDDIMALYSDQIAKSSLANPRDGRIADIDSDEVGFYSNNIENPEMNTGSISSKLSELSAPQFNVDMYVTDQPLNYSKTLEDGTLNKFEKNLLSLSIPSYSDQLAEFYLFSLGPSWIKLDSPSSEEAYEVIMDSQTPLKINSQWHFGSIRAGNANNLYVIINNAAFGPMGKSSVIKNVEISETNLIGTLPYDSDITRMFNKIMP